MKLRKGDTVRVITGKDKGREGIVERVFPSKDKVIVNGVNTASKHAKARRANDKAGIIDRDMPIHASNVMLVHKGKTVRVGSMQFHVHTSIGRCLAPHANPETGQRDRPILATLTRVFGQEKPTLAVGLAPAGAGNIRLGDQVVLEG